MMKVLGLLLLFMTVKAQILFPGKVANDDPAPAEEVPEASDTELFEALDVVSTRQTINTFGSSSCVTSNGERGTCQSFSSCPAYTAMRRNLHRPSVLNFLRGRICRRLRRTVHLCCTSTNAIVRPSLPTSAPSSANPLLQQQCGRVLVSRVVNGVDTVPGEWPWVAAVGNRVGNTFSADCTGTLITRRHVLSAGHCFAPGQPPLSMVRLGANDLTRRTSTVPPQDINIRDRRDGGYNPRTNENDITILILDHDATLNDYVQIACLPFNLRSRNLLGDSLVVTGWGRTRFENPQTSDVLMKAVVPVRDTASCARDYQKLPVNRRPVIDGRSLCAGDGTTDSCAGDSGGPLHYLDLADGKYYVVGIVSFGVGCARPDFPGVYTRVTSFLDWIERNTQ